MTAPYTKSFEAEVLERLSRIETHAELAAGHVADHESRLRVVEKRQWYVAGIAGVIAFVAPWLSHLSFK